jgi:hypothetical protein
MKKLAILTTAAVLGASSLAVADPQVTVRDHRDRHGDRYDDQDRRFDDDNDAPIYFDDDADFGESRFNRDSDGRYWRGKRQFIRAEQQPQWVSLGTAGSGKTGLRVMGRYQSLKLDVNGWLRIKQVVVQLADGTTQKVRMSSAMNGRRRAPLVIDLGGTKKVERIFIYASQYGRGTVSVQGLEGKRYYWKRFSQR